MNRVIEVTFVLIVLFLVLSRATGFSRAISSISQGYVQAVKALQGR